MNPRDRRLGREIFLVLVVKIIAILLLWWCFVHERTVAVDTTETAHHLGAAHQESNLARTPQ